MKLERVFNAGELESDEDSIAQENHDEEEEPDGNQMELFHEKEKDLFNKISSLPDKKWKQDDYNKVNPQLN